MRSHLVGLLVIVAALCSGCATNAPMAEVRLVEQAFQDLNAASAPLLDDLAVAERAQGKVVAEVRAKRNTQTAMAAGTDSDARSVPVSAVVTEEGRAAQSDECGAVGLLAIDSLSVKVQDGFCISDSYYYSELADPPATATFRRSLAAVESYTQVLLILAEGRNLEAAEAEVQSLAGNVGGVLEIAGASGAGVAVQGIVSALQPLLDLAAKHSNSKELARNVKEVAPKAFAVVEQLRLAAPELFATLTESALARLQRAKLKPETSAEIVRVEAARMEAYRTAVSNYVVLLDQYERLLMRLVDSYDTAGKAVTLSGLVQQSAQLSAHADAWRRTYSALRMGF